jgi:hypothetical protein
MLLLCSTKKEKKTKACFVAKEEANNPWPLVVHPKIFLVLLERSI